MHIAPQKKIHLIPDPMLKLLCCWQGISTKKQQLKQMMLFGGGGVSTF